MRKFFNEKVFIVKGAKRPFHSKKDAIYYCEDNNIDKSEIVSFDSTKEYDRYQELLELQRQGTIKALQRQVAFELIPEYSVMEKVGQKSRKTYKVNGITFAQKTYALMYCKENELPRTSITVVEEKIPIMKKRIIENEACYTADFTYYEGDKYIVEDVKSDYTRKEKDYILRRKLMLYIQGIIIRET